MDRVIGGTPRGSTSLCGTCRHAHRIVGLNMQEVTHCNAVSHTPIVRFPVATCSTYNDQRLPSMEAMQSIAWEVRTRNRGQVGFAPGGGREIEIRPPDRGEGANPMPSPTPYQVKP